MWVKCENIPYIKNIILFRPQMVYESIHFGYLVPFKYRSPSLVVPALYDVLHCLPIYKDKVD